MALSVSKLPSGPICPGDFALPAGEAPFELLRPGFDETVRRLPRFSAHGADGWRFEHLQAVQRHSAPGMDAMFAWCADLARGTYLPAGQAMPADVAGFLSQARLLALAKPAGGVRPIAVGSCLRRMPAAAVARQLKQAFAAALLPVQFGVGVDGAAELMVTAVRTILAAHPGWVVFTTDARNAFNSVSRRAIIGALRECFPQLLPFVSVFYARDGDLVIRMPWGAECVRSRSGVQQGDPLGSALFSLALQHLLLRVAATAVGAAAGARVLAFIDDVYLVGPLQWATAAYGQLAAEYPSVGLEMRHAKGGVYSPCPLPAGQLVDTAHDDGTHSFTHGPTGVRLLGQLPLPAAECSSPFRAAGTSRWLIRHLPTGRVYRDPSLVVVGVPIGHSGHVTRRLRGAFGSSAGLLTSLTLLLQDPQCVLLLARCCVLPQVTHFLRTCLPMDVWPLCAPFDGAMLRLLERAAHLRAPLPPDAAAVVQLPLRHGGFGFTPTATVCPAAFMAGSLFALDALCAVDRRWQEAVQAFMAGVTAPAAPVAVGASRLPEALRVGHAGVLALLPPASRADVGYPDDLALDLASTAHLQRRIMRAHALRQRDAVRSGLTVACQAPADGPGAGDAADADRRALARQRLEAWEAAASRGGTDYLAVMPDIHVADAEELARPSGGHFALAAVEFRVTICLHLGLPCPLVPVMPPLVCPCSRLHGGQGEPPVPHDIDPLLRVLSSCTGRYGAAATSGTWRHNQWARVWVQFLAAMGVVQAAEPRGLDVGCRRPDILVTMPGQPALRLCDIAITSPISPGRVRMGFPGGVGGAVRSMERTKELLYRGPAAAPSAWRAVLPQPVTVPLVGSTLGRIGVQAWAFFDAVFRTAQAGGLMQGCDSLPQHLRRVYWQRRLSVSLRREVASVVHRRIAAAQAGGAGPGLPAYLRGCPLAAARRLPRPGELSGAARAAACRTDCAEGVFGMGFRGCSAG